MIRPQPASAAPTRFRVRFRDRIPVPAGMTNGALSRSRLPRPRRPRVRVVLCPAVSSRTFALDARSACGPQPVAVLVHLSLGKACNPSKT
jgi:hypothetical protein